MGAFIGGVAVGWVDFKVLTHGVVPLAVKMCLDKDMELVVAAPKPVQGVFAKGRGIGHMDSRVFLCESGLFGGVP